MRNARPLLTLTRQLFPEELAITSDTELLYFAGKKLVYIAINSQMVRWSRHDMFKSSWLAHFERGSRAIYPLSAHEIPGVASERLFSLMNDSDAHTGIPIVGPKSQMRTEEDIDALIKRVNMAYRLKSQSVLAVNIMRRALRVRTHKAVTILRNAPDAAKLVEGALPHLALQAVECRRWLERGGPLNIDMTGEAIRTC